MAWLSLRGQLGMVWHGTAWIHTASLACRAEPYHAGTVLICQCEHSIKWVNFGHFHFSLVCAFARYLLVQFSFF